MVNSLIEAAGRVRGVHKWHTCQAGQMRARSGTIVAALYARELGPRCTTPIAPSRNNKADGQGNPK